MQTVDPNSYNELSFPDFSVETMNFDEKKKELTIITNGGFLDSYSGPEFKQCRLFFYQWESLVIKKFYYDRPECEYLNGENFELLKDLPEVEISESEVLLTGFSSSSGEWIEWLFKNLKIKIEYSI